MADDVKELDPGDPRATVCGTCGRGWDDSVSTAWTPVPAGRCPFENDHADDGPGDGPTVAERFAGRVLEARVYRLATRDRVTRRGVDGSAERVDAAELEPLEVTRDGSGWVVRWTVGGPTEFVRLACTGAGAWWGVFYTSYPSYATGRGDVVQWIPPAHLLEILADAFYLEDVPA